MIILFNLQWFLFLILIFDPIKNGTLKIHGHSFYTLSNTPTWNTSHFSDCNSELMDAISTQFAHE